MSYSIALINRALKFPYSEASNFAGFLSFLAWDPCGVIYNEK